MGTKVMCIEDEGKLWRTNAGKKWVIGKMGLNDGEPQMLGIFLGLSAWGLVILAFEEGVM